MVDLCSTTKSMTIAELQSQIERIERLDAKDRESSKRYSNIEATSTLGTIPPETTINYLTPNSDPSGVIDGIAPNTLSSAGNVSVGGSPLSRSVLPLDRTLMLPFDEQNRKGIQLLAYLNNVDMSLVKLTTTGSDDDLD
ncbi:hypothetical protein QFC19_004573 [Naganishia cerealis]|uniref:Uncharacterized protein n=1 Tax=Naganishia cerealis TaxID=610337 RepID=A0ACC2VUR3_9TREE|nr:hypothetical protein QFC19_004573 [Naganishia cerealis]